MEEPKKSYPRISLLAFFYTLCVVTIISLVCLIYALHLKNEKTEERLTKIESSIQSLENTKTDSAE